MKTRQFGYMGNAIAVHQMVEGLHLVDPQASMWRCYGTLYGETASPEFAASAVTWNVGLSRLSIEDTAHWVALDEQLALRPPTDLWACLGYTDDEWRQSQDPGPALGRFVDKVRLRWAGRLHVSALPYFGDSLPAPRPGPPCKSVKDAYSAALWAAIDARIDASVDILRGPLLPTLSTAEKAQPPGSAFPHARCFGNKSGLLKWGATLSDVDWT